MVLKTFQQPDILGIGRHCRGAWLGHFYPTTGIQMETVGKTFVDIIKLFIAPIIFLTIVLGISGMGDLKKVGRIGAKSLLYFEIVTTLALAIGRWRGLSRSRTYKIVSTS